MDEKTSASAPERVGQVGDHQPADLLRAWLRGDRHPEAVHLEALDDADVADLATTLRQCATDCLNLATVRGVADLVIHAATHGALGDVTVRAFGVLAAAVHRCDASDDVRPPVPPQMVPYVGEPLWCVDRNDGELSRVIGFVPHAEEDCYAGGRYGDEADEYFIAYFGRPVILKDGWPMAEVVDSEYKTVGLYFGEDQAREVASTAYWASRERAKLAKARAVADASAKRAVGAE